MRKLALLLLLPFVASCGSPIVFRAYQNPEISTSYSSKKGEGYETLKEYVPIATQGGNLPDSYSSIYNNGNRFSLPSLGRQKLLVIPVDFQEYPGEAEEIEMISHAFFGQNDADAFPSVAEYFDRSSYSHFQLEGRVAPSWFRSSQYSYADLSSVYGSKRTEQTLQKIYLEALEWYDATYPDSPHSEYAYSDGHGHQVVPVYFIYRLSVEKYFTAPRLIKPRNELCEGGFSAARRADERDSAARLERHAEILDKRRFEL